MGSSPDAYEFDKTNPYQNLRDNLNTIRKFADEGRRDVLNKIIDECADSEGANLLKSIIAAREDPGMKTRDKVVGAADAGDIAGALAIIDGELEAGRLDTRQALNIRATVYDRVGDMEAKLKIIEDADGMNGTIQYGQRVDLLYRLGRYDELADLCDALQDSYYDRTDLYLSRARLMHVRGDAAGAQRHADAILKLEEYVPEVYELIGDILADGGDLRGAVMRYNEALEKDYNTIHYHVKKAEALAKMGRPDAAALACRRGLKIRPQNKRLKEILAESQ